MESSAGGLLEGMGLDGDTLAPMETDEPTTTDPKAKSKLTPAMATRIKQIKPLLSGEIISMKCRFTWSSHCKSFPLFYIHIFLYFFLIVLLLSLQLHPDLVELLLSFLGCW